MLAPLLFVIIPALVSLALILALFILMRRSDQKNNQVPTKLIKKNNSNIQRSNSESIVILSRTREVISQRPYHLTVITTNLMKLPYHVVYVINWAMSLKCRPQSNPAVFKMLKFFFVLNHSINFLVFLIFHREFKSSLMRIFCRCVRK